MQIIINYILFNHTLTAHGKNVRTYALKIIFAYFNKFCAKLVTEISGENL